MPLSTLISHFLLLLCQNWECGGKSSHQAACRSPPLLSRHIFLSHGRGWGMDKARSTQGGVSSLSWCMYPGRWPQKGKQAKCHHYFFIFLSSQPISPPSSWLYVHVFCFCICGMCQLPIAAGSLVHISAHKVPLCT